MGLDIYHKKVTDTPERCVSELMEDEFPSIIYACELPPAAFSRLGFDRFIKKELVPGYFDKVAIFLNEENKALAKPYLLNSKDPEEDFQLFMVGPLKDCEEKLLDFEIQNNLEPDTREILASNIEIGNRVIEFQSVLYDCKVKREILYYEEMGYQRKGMSAEFYEYFKKDAYYVEKRDFMKLLDFMDPENHMYDPENIRKNFIDNYEEGKSVLSLSW